MTNQNHTPREFNLFDAKAQAHTMAIGSSITISITQACEYAPWCVLVGSL